MCRPIPDATLRRVMIAPQEPWGPSTPSFRSSHPPYSATACGWGRFCSSCSCFNRLHRPCATPPPPWFAVKPASGWRQTRHRARAIVVAAAVTAWVACWWISLAAPLGVTSLLPLVLLPLLGAVPLKDVAVNYANPNIFLFMGGFMLALGIERWGLHRRIALHIVGRVGVDESRIVLGFMIASGLLSMWISNTATTLRMFPIALAIIRSLPAITIGRDHANRSRFPAALMLGITAALPDWAG